MALEQLREDHESLALAERTLGEHDRPDKVHSLDIAVLLVNRHCLQEPGKADPSILVPIEEVQLRKRAHDVFANVFTQPLVTTSKRYKVIKAGFALKHQLRVERLVCPENTAFVC